MTASTHHTGPETPAVQSGAATGPAATASSAGTDHLAQQARQDAEAAGTQARKVADDLASGARGTAEELKRDAEHMLDDARRQAETAAGEQKNRAAERLTGFASALRHASSDLDEQGQSVVSGFVQQAADGLDGFSGALRRNDVDDLVGSVEDFARRQPAVFIGGAVLAGFGIARFVKSSTERRRSRGTEPPRSTFETRPGYGAAPGTTYEGGV